MPERYAVVVVVVVVVVVIVAAAAVGGGGGGDGGGGDGGGGDGGGGDGGGGTAAAAAAAVFVVVVVDVDVVVVVVVIVVVVVVVAAAAVVVVVVVTAAAAAVAALSVVAVLLLLMLAVASALVTNLVVVGGGAGGVVVPCCAGQGGTPPKLCSVPPISTAAHDHAGCTVDAEPRLHRQTGVQVLRGACAGHRARASPRRCGVGGDLGGLWTEARQAHHHPPVAPGVQGCPQRDSPRVPSAVEHRLLVVPGPPGHHVADHVRPGAVPRGARRAVQAAGAGRRGRDVGGGGGRQQHLNGRVAAAGGDRGTAVEPPGRDGAGRRGAPARGVPMSADAAGGPGGPGGEYGDAGPAAARQLLHVVGAACGATPHPPPPNQRPNFAGLTDFFCRFVGVSGILGHLMRRGGRGERSLLRRPAGGDLAWSWSRSAREGGRVEGCPLAVFLVFLPLSTV